MSKCVICGEPMPPGEEMFNYHGLSGSCPKPPLGYTGIYQDPEVSMLKRAIAWANNSLFGSHNFFLSLNGGEPDEHHLATAIEKLKEQTREDFVEKESLRVELREMDAENTRLLDEVVRLQSTMQLALDALTYQGTMGLPRRQRRTAAIAAIRAALQGAKDD